MKIKINHIKNRSGTNHPSLQKVIRLSYDDYPIKSLPDDYIIWVLDVLQTGYALINIGNAKKRDYRANIILEIIFVCILDGLKFTKSKDAKTSLISLAKFSGREFLPRELKDFGEKYTGLKAIKEYVEEDVFRDIEMALDNDLISKAESIGELDKKKKDLAKLHKGIQKRYIKTGGRKKDPFLGAILYKCYCAFDGKLNQTKNERIAQFVDVIYSNDFIGEKNVKDLVRRRLDYLLKPKGNETIDQKISVLENQWNSMSFLSNVDKDFLKELMNTLRCYYDLPPKSRTNSYVTNWYNLVIRRHEDATKEIQFRADHN